MQDLKGWTIESWARYVRSHKDWKRIHTEFIDSQFIKHEGFLKRISSLPDAKKKIDQLYYIPKIPSRKMKI